MRTKDIFKIAFRNLSAGKSMVKKMVFGITFIVMLVLCFFMVIDSYEEYIIKFNSEHVEDCYYYTLLDEREMSAETMHNILDKYKKELHNADETVILCNIVLKDENVSNEAGKVNICIGDVWYKAKKYYTNRNKIHQNIRGYMWPIEFGIYRNGMAIFPKNIINAYGEEYILGEYPVNEGEIMLDSYILDVYGISNAEELIGNNITISSVSEDGNDIVFENYKLTGVFKGELISERESSLTSDNHLEHIYVNVRGKDETRFKLQQGTVRYYFDDYAKFIENYKYMNHVISMNIDVLKEADVNLTGYGMQYFILYWIMENIGKLLILVAAVIGLIITASVIYIFQFYKDRNEHYIAMLENIGMTRKDRMRIFRVEVSVMVLISTAIGIYLSVIFLMLFNMVTTQMLNFEIVFGVKAFVIALVCSLLYFGLCFLIVMRKRKKRDNVYYQKKSLCELKKYSKKLDIMI